MPADQKTQLIRFGPMLPDRGALPAGSQYSLLVKNMVAHTNGWIPMHGWTPLASLSGFPEERVVGAGQHIQGKFLYKIHISTYQGLVYIVDPRTAGSGSYWWDIQDISPASAPSYMPQVGAFFTQFGDAMIRTTGESNVIDYYIDDGSMAQYEQLIAEGAAESSKYYYQARFCGTIPGRVVLAYVYGGINADARTDYETYKNRVAWSARNDPQNFHDESYEDGATGSGWLELVDDHGPITGLSCGADYSLVFKARTIYRMVETGGLYQFQVEPIPQEIGTVWPHSIVRAGNDVYFWSGSGPAVYRGASHSVEWIGQGQVSRSIYDPGHIMDSISDELSRLPFQPDIDVSVLSAAVDAYSGNVTWTLPTYKATWSCDSALVYNIPTGLFSVIEPPERGEPPQPRFTYSLGTIDTGDYFRPLRDTLFFVGVGTGEMIGLKRVRDGSDEYPALVPGEFRDQKAKNVYPYFQFYPRHACRIVGVRLVMARRGDSLETVTTHYRVSVYSRHDYSNDLASHDEDVINHYGSANDADRRGFVRTPDVPYRTLHAVVVELQGEDANQSSNLGNYADIEGIEIELEKGGEK